MSATNFGGGASAGINQMVGSFAGGFGTPGMGGTFTDPAMAYSPHYGMAGASTTLEQEKLMMRGGRGRTGMEWAGRFAPPGVSAGDFAFAAMQNNIERDIQSNEAASMAGGAAFASTAGGLLAGSVAYRLAGIPGRMAGGAAASGMFGAGAAGAGRAIGGLAAGVGAMFLASDYVGGKIQDHFSGIEQTLGVTRELGEIVGGGRGLNRSQKYEMGIAAREAATSMKMDVNQLGDIMALSREAGMLPNSTDPQKLKQQIIEYSTAIKESSQTLHSTLATATQVVKSATQQGLTIEEGVLRAGMGTLGGSPLYNMGVGVARGMGFAGAQGGQLFAGAMGQGAGSGISGEERAILGGSMGVAALIGGTQLQAAASPLGTLQLMAARGGRPLGSMMDLPGQALEAMGQGGDMIGNMIKFQVHGDEYRRGIGSKGIRTMAMQQLGGMADMIEDLSGGSVTGADAKRYAAMQMYGMTGTQAEAYVGGMGRPMGGGGDGYERAHELATQTNNRQMGLLGAAISKMPAPEGRASFGWGYAGEGATAGMLIGSVVPGIGTAVGTAVGAAGGFIAGNAKAIWQAGGDLVDSVGDLFRGTNEAADRRGRRSAARYEASEQGIKDKMGVLEIDPDFQARGMVANLRGVSLNMGSTMTRAVNMSEGALRIAGLQPVAPGPGTLQTSGGVSFSSVEVQRLANAYGGKALGVKDIRKAENIAYEMFHAPGAADHFARGESIQAFGALGAPYDTMSGPQKHRVTIQAQVKSINDQIGILSSDQQDPNNQAWQDAASTVNQNIQALARGITDPKEKEAFLADVRSGGVFRENSLARKVLTAGGVELDKLKGVGDRARQTLGVAIKETVAQQQAGRTDALVRVVGRAGANREDVRKITDEMTKDSQWDELQSRIARGESGKGVDEMFQGVTRRAQVRAKVQGDIVDPNAALTKKITQTDATTGKEIETTLAENIALDQKKLVQTGVARRRGPEVHSRAIGFGEQESAMSAINRSLQRTHSMIETLEKKLSGGAGKPVTPSGSSVDSTAKK
jgi:hypothetical protein